MNLGKYITDKVLDWALKTADDRSVMLEAANRAGDGTSSASSSLDIDPKAVGAQTMQKYKDAVLLATDRENPDWVFLAPLYDNLLLDNHAASVIDSRILFLQRSPFKMVDDNGKEDDEATELLHRPWHEDCQYWSLFSKFGGRQLLEFFDLNEHKELAMISVIPQTHFNVKEGVIMESNGGGKKWSYKEGKLANYYLQVGKDYDLGMLERLAPIILAKKLGLGAMQDYVDKYGVPPLFITTDREDANRLKQLQTAAQNFKKGFFMIGQGNEKFEIPAINGQGVAPFEQLIKIVHDDVAKRVLGGSGITDEKSFVGSAEIQFRLAKDRFESDKLFYKYLFNTHIKPRLVKLSEVYARFEHLTFEWDDTESMSKKEIIEAAVSLGSVYEVDPEYITEYTGIPVLGSKKNVNTVPTGGGSEKK